LKCSLLTLARTPGLAGWAIAVAIPAKAFGLIDIRRGQPQKADIERLEKVWRRNGHRPEVEAETAKLAGADQCLGPIYNDAAIDQLLNGLNHECSRL
jgi:hypothetical protein